MTIFEIPTYDIVFWYFLRPETEIFRRKAIILAEAFPYRVNVYNGVQDIHWGMENEHRAIAIFERLKPLAAEPHVLVLRLMSSRKDFESLTYKDVRPSLKYYWGMS
jgi:hypothetical protein